MALGPRLMQALRPGALIRLALACAALASLAAPARAQIGSDRYSAMVVDQRSGAILVSANADEQRHPASLTKMMTLYMLFEAIREGRVSLDSRITFSEEAASRPPSKLGIAPGNSITVEQAILALVTRSANDVAAAVGERLGGSEARFGQMMTMRARSIGMSRTTFRNASGLPDPDQVTTARDMTTLGRRLFADFPDRWHYFSVATAQFGGMRIRNHNRMLETYEGVDGIKTGYIRDSGFNIVTSASRGGQRLIGAVFGGMSWVERDAHMASLLDQGFSQLGVNVARNNPGVLRTAQAGTLNTAARAQAAAAPAPATRSASSSRTTSVPTTRSAAAVQPPRTPQAAPRTAATRQASQPAPARSTSPTLRTASLR
ncbi:D-alanyl-D-alanine carboxypeptidase family protein [Falsiroseomonas sp. HW251]|uniref:D-alanyl-D-alanine carboxypeptidase family protein n=1 Tax=Falsiroseomonas sp. HW251 TaxID=3390998 RepID=UPI003D323785